MAPKELLTLKAEHFDCKAGQFVLGAKEWKCGRKTNRSRYIGLSPKWIAWANERLGEMEEGESFFVNKRGRAWTGDALVKSFTAARAAAGLPANVTAYVLRHTFISRAVKAGLPVAHIAHQCGTSVGLVQRVYDKSFKDVELRANVVNMVAQLAAVQ